MKQNHLRRSLTICIVTFALALAVTPASAQYFFIDVNGDGESDAADVLHSGVSSVDIYLDTNHTSNGTLVTCTNTEPGPLSISSYTFIVGWDPAGGGKVTFGPWTDNMGFPIHAGGAQAGHDLWLARAKPSYLAPGKYKLGTLAVTVTGMPILNFLSSTPIDSTGLTSFGSPCPGQDFDNTIKLGSDFTDARGTSPADDSPRTTWRTIDELYR